MRDRLKDGCSLDRDALRVALAGTGFVVLHGADLALGFLRSQAPIHLMLLYNERIVVNHLR